MFDKGRSLEGVGRRCFRIAQGEKQSWTVKGAFGRPYLTSPQSLAIRMGELTLRGGILI
jgi:hypothetical protein